MSEEKNASRKYVIGQHGSAKDPKHLCRFSYLHALTPKENKQNGKNEYSVVALIPKTSPDGEAIRKIIDELKNETWLSKGKRLPPKFWNPLRDGDTDCKQNGDPYGPECAGHYIVSAKRDDKKAPDVVGTMRDAEGKLIRLTDKQIKSGDYGRISINLSAYTKGDSGVGAYINNIQLVTQGEALGGGADADDDFGSYDDDEGGYDPLA